MPPYSAQQESTVFDNEPFVDFPVADSKVNVAENDVARDDARDDTTAPTASTKDSQQSSSSSIFERISDFNPCVSIVSGASASNAGPGAVPTLSPPAGFGKTRKCAECGGNCSKFQGYKKEVSLERSSTDALFDEDDSVKSLWRSSTNKKNKIYYHKWCYQVKQYRDEHKENSGFRAVMHQLLDHFAALELAARIKAEEEAKRKAEEERLRALEEEEARLAADAEQDTTRYEVNLVDGKKRNKTSKLLKRIKKSFSSFSCKGKKATLDAIEPQQ